MTKITHNQHEDSVTIQREDGSPVDFVHMEQELIIGETGRESHTQIVLSLAEAQALQEHLYHALV